MMNRCKDRKIISVEERDAVPKSVSESFTKNKEQRVLKENSAFLEAISIFWGNCIFISTPIIIGVDIRVL
jgi:hypothetical protein